MTPAQVFIIAMILLAIFLVVVINVVSKISTPNNEPVDDSIYEPYGTNYQAMLGMEAMVHVEHQHKLDIDEESSKQSVIYLPAGMSTVERINALDASKIESRGQRVLVEHIQQQTKPEVKEGSGHITDHIAFIINGK